MDEDKKLYSNFLKGNETSLNTLILKYRNNVIYFISRYTNSIDIAEDLFQDVILYVLENKENYDFNYSFKTYLYIIAKSKALNYLKKNKQESIDISAVSNTISEDKLLEIVFSKERKEKIKNVIKQLKRDYQIVIYLTQIEGLSYSETAQIMNKTERQIKNLTYNAKKKLKKLLIKERIIEMKNNKFIRLLSWLIIIVFVSTGITFAAKAIINKINNAKLNPSFSGTIGNVNENNVWVGTFQLAWNELIENLGMPIEFNDGISELAENLNEQSFTKDMLDKNDYYIGQGKIEPNLKKQIENDLKNKFNTNSKVLDNINWNTEDEEYLIYSMLKKKFTFQTPFIERNSATFGDSTQKVKYFGLDATTLDETFKQVTVLFYNSETDFAIKIDTIEGEEVILYKTDTIKNFEDNYAELENKTNSYTGRKTMIRDRDELKIPFIKVNSVINYDELCNRIIKNTEQYYIKHAIQIVDFELNNYGGNLTSEAYIDIYCSIGENEPRYFNFDDTFILYLKESSKNKPYFALLIDNIDVLLSN